MALRMLFLALFLLYCKTNAATQQAIVGLWSDSECNSKSGATSNFGEPDPIALNFTLELDVCGVPGATVHSYRVRQRGICANGTTAFPHYYNSNNCTADPTDEDPNPGLGKRINHRRQFDGVLDGECLALVAFNSLAFVCEGVSPQNVKVNTLSASASSSTVTSVSSSLISSFSSSRLPTATGSPITNSSAISSPASNSSATNSRATNPSATISRATNSSATNPSRTSLSTRTSPTTNTPTTNSPTTSSPISKSTTSTGTGTGMGIGSTVGVLVITCSVFSLLSYI